MKPAPQPTTLPPDSGQRATLVRERRMPMAPTPVMAQLGVLGSDQTRLSLLKVPLYLCPCSSSA